MDASFRRVLALGLVWASIPNLSGFAQQNPRLANLPSQPATVEGAPEFTFLLFWKENNAATQAMAATLKGSLPQKSQKTEWSAINVTDPANKELVERYKVSRAPMPMVMCVAANGAITGAIPDRLNDQTIDKLLVSPTMTQCMKALQDGKLVLVHVKADDNATIPQGAADFAADPSFKDRTATVSFRRDDPNEKRFLADMQVDAKAKARS